MRREGRKPLAARRRPESSDLHNPFPHSGNDNTQARKPNAPSAKTCHPFALRPAFLGRLFPTRLYHLRPVGVDSGLRRNDDEEKIGWIAIPTTPLPCLSNT